MRFVWSSALKDLKRHLRDPLEIATWLGIPLLIGLMIILATGGKSGPRPQAHLLVADEDDSFLSGMLVGALSQETAGGLIRAENVEKLGGIERIEKGEATALLIIPNGFGDALLLEEPSVLKLITNPSQQILPKIVEESLSMLLDGVFYLHRVVGDDLRTFAGGPAPGSDTFSDLQISNFSVKVNRLAARLSDYLNPLLIQVESKIQEEEEESENNVSAGALFLPGILFMSLLFMALAISADLWQEKEQRTLLRMVVSPQSVKSFVLGKLLTGAIFMLIISSVTLIIGYSYFSLAAATLPLAVLWAVLSGTMLTTLLMLIQLFASSQRGGNILTMALIFPLMMVGGNFFPFEAMQSWMAAIGKMTPNGYALEQLKNIMLQRTNIVDSLIAFTCVFTSTLILFFVAAWRLKAKFVIG
jgi:ABC-type multidrug transport system permease subunit